MSKVETTIEHISISYTMGMRRNGFEQGTELIVGTFRRIRSSVRMDTVNVSSFMLHTIFCPFLTVQCNRDNANVTTFTAIMGERSYNWQGHLKHLGRTVLQSELALISMLRICSLLLADISRKRMRIRRASRLRQSQRTHYPG